MQLPKVKAVLYRSKTHKDGTHPIMIRITQNRRMTYKGIGHSVHPEAWNNDTGAKSGVIDHLYPEQIDHP